MAAFCAVAALSLPFSVKESTAEETPKMDWLGVLPLAVSIGSLLMAFNEAGKLGAANWVLVVVLFIIGIAGVIFFYNIEKRVKHPLVSVEYLGISIFVGITYAGIANIMLNGLGIVLSPANNQGYLPGMNAGAFNLGAGISFAILFAVSTAFSDNDGGYAAGMWAGVIILVLAFLCSLLIPRPESITDTVAAQVQAEEAAQAAS